MQKAKEEDADEVGGTVKQNSTRKRVFVLLSEFGNRSFQLHCQV